MAEKFKRMSVRRGLETALAVIRNKKHWVQNTMCDYIGPDTFEDINEDEFTADPRQCAFCAVGAVRNAFGSEEHPNYEKAITQLAKAAAPILTRGGERPQGTVNVGSAEGDVITVNDTYGRRNTLTMFRRAIGAKGGAR